LRPGDPGDIFIHRTGNSEEVTMQVKKTLIAIAIAIPILAIVIARTTEDYDEARAKMSTSEVQFLDQKLMKIRKSMSREDLRDLLGRPRTELSFGLEWKGPSWSRARVYYSDDGKQITRVSFRKMGSFDIDFRPWELRSRS